MVLSINNVCFIPLRNKNKEIINYTTVDKKYFHHLIKFRFYSHGGYVAFSIKRNNHLLHRYIYKELLKENIDSKIVDHIDNHKLNNTINNLRICTQQENAMNKTKQKNTTSKYYGVSYSSKRKIYIATLTIQDKKLSKTYKNEHHAAHQYNLWIDEYKLKFANKNIIKEENISNFIIHTKIKNKTNDNIDLPEGISFSKNYYRIGRSYNFKTFEEASKKLNELKLILKNKENQDEINRLNTPIKRNIIELFNKKKEKIGECLVDDKYYYILSKLKWYLNPSGYVYNKKLLHRYIYKELLKKNIDNKIIDHINSNKLDNRLCNLRIVTHQENALNCSKQKNTTSKYIGVSFKKKHSYFECCISIINKEFN